MKVCLAPLLEGPVGVRHRRHHAPPSHTSWNLATPRWGLWDDPVADRCQLVASGRRSAFATFDEAGCRTPCERARWFGRVRRGFGVRATSVVHRVVSRVLLLTRTTRPLGHLL